MEARLFDVVLLLAAAVLVPLSKRNGFGCLIETTKEAAEGLERVFEQDTLEREHAAW